MENLEQVRDWTGFINNVANGYKKSQILFTAFKVGIFDVLEEERTPSEIASLLGWSERGITMLLDGLYAIELIEKKQGKYKNTPMASLCLAKSGKYYQGNILRHNMSSWNAWQMLEERVRTGTCAPPGENRPAEALRDFILGMCNIAKISAQEVLQMVDLSGFQHMLDLAGGPATYAIKFLQAHPQMRATLFDRAEVIEIAQEQVREAGLEERFSYLAGDCLTDDIGTGYDFVFVSNLIHSFSYSENASLIKKIYNALISGGTLIIKDFILENDRLGPAFSLIFALHMLVHTPEGNCYTFNEIKEWTDQAGFANEQAFSLTPQTRLWVVRKP